MAREGSMVVGVGVESKVGGTDEHLNLVRQVGVVRRCRQRDSPR